MSLYAISDLHLSKSTGKPMDIFDGWDDYMDRLDRNWRKVISDNDTVMVPGDISWGLTMDEAKADFEYLDSLPGKKIISKGNHDYWWTTKTRIERWTADNGWSTLSYLFNNSFEYDDVSICGTRGWIFPADGAENDVRVYEREAGRLILSLESAKCEKKIVFLHYPPIYVNIRMQKIIDILSEHGIERCFYGHVHGQSIHYAFSGIDDGIEYRCISADNLKFSPYLIIK